MSVRLVIIASLAALTSCQSNNSKTIGSLAYTPHANEEVKIAPLSHQQVRAEYTDLLDVFEDQHLKEQIERRVADVYMMEGVHEQNHSAPTTNHYVEAIKAYRNILEKYPDSPDNAEVLYQLAKAYDMEGDMDRAMAMLSELTTRHPYYVNVAEAHFRMGDLHFNNQNYRAAQASYTAVTRYENARLAVNARYMLGWSLYKQSQFHSSLNEFALVLNHLMASVTDITELSKAQQPMATDTLHSISLALDKLGGAETISTIAAIANKDYTWMVYDNLGNYYLEKELYESSAEAYRLFVNKHKNSAKAPLLHSKIIGTYLEGGFPSLALREKESYVESYGLYSNYAGNRDGMNPFVAASVKVYLDELARHNYNLGQTLHEQTETDSNSSTDAAHHIDHERVSSANPQATKAYQKAAGFYLQYAKTFPKDERIDEVYFLLSESLFLAQQYADAIAGYERVAYRPQGNSAKAHSNNAGYAAIIAYQRHITTLPPSKAEAKAWQAKAVESMLLFANTFHTDSRAVSVLTNAAEYLFGLNEYERALKVSTDLIKNNDGLDKTLKKAAYGIIAHSYFNLGDYQKAELNYIHQRQLIDSDNEEYQKVSERLATTIYRLSEQSSVLGEQGVAVRQLLKIKVLAPQSTLRVAAQYEAATMLISMKQWQRAIEELEELSTLYPEHPLSVEFPRRLAFSHEKNESWKLAANAYQSLYEKDPDPVIRQEALFIAATMFEKDQSYLQAIEHFRRYANTYEEPADTLMEARFNLAVNYERVGDVEKHRFWLNKIIQGQKRLKNTERNRWLAAWANAKYGDYYAREFHRLRLYLPLVQSLPKKNEMLSNASQRYQMSAEFGILEFATMSSFKIAELYHQFAASLRAAPRPASLSTAEQSMYNEVIEEQAAPFDDLSMELYQANIDRAWDGSFNEWINKSFIAMKTMNPRRYGKEEIIVSYGDEIH